jgi:Ca2+-binding RTX toxin-like protein
MARHIIINGESDKIANDAPETEVTAVSKPNISVNDVIIGEGEGYVDFVVRLDAPATADLTISYNTYTDTANQYNDITDVAGQLTFLAGETLKIVRVYITDDSLIEANETFTFNLTNPSANVNVARAPAVAVIYDNDAPSGTPVVSVSDFTIDEAAGQATFVITLNRPSTETVSLHYATQNGTALAGSDYVAKSGNLNFAPGQVAQTVTVTLTNDTVKELSESFNLVLSNLVHATTLDNTAAATIYQNDASAVSKPNLSVGDAVVSEDRDYVDFVVTLDAPATANLTVSYNTYTGTADQYNDITDVAGQLTFAAGETEKTVRVYITHDSLIEANETFTFNLTNPSANVNVARAQAVAVIYDNDAPSGTPVVSVSDFTIDEAAGQATFVITLNRPSTETVSLHYATQNGTALAGSDYVATSGNLNFAPGQVIQTVTVTLTNDTVKELSESFNLVLSNLVHATTLDNAATATIYQNDASAVSKPNLSVGDAVVSEDRDYVDFAVTLDAPATAAITVYYDTYTGTANQYNDITDVAGKLTFAAGETEKTVRVYITHDSLIEANETFNLELYSPSANVNIARAQAVAVIYDNDVPSGKPVVSISDFTIDEAAGQATFVITLDRPSTETVSLHYATQNGTAQAGSDYVAVNGNLNFTPGQVVQTVTVTLTNDTVRELSESFHLALSNLVNATTLDGKGTATIYANDGAAASKVNLSVDDVVVSEDRDYVDFVVTLDAPATAAVKVSYSTNNGTASQYNDITDVSGQLTFVAGETEKTVRVYITHDSDPEANETFTLNLSSSSANANIARAQAVATIVDNDAPSGTPVLTVSDFTVDEADGEATFVITLDRPSTAVVSFNFSTQSASAEAGSDYIATSATINMTPGQTAVTVKVPLVNDTRAEGAEVFNLVLTNLVHATTADPVGTAFIYQNDGAVASKPNLTVDDVIVREGEDYVDFIVRLDSPSASAITVNYGTNGSTASQYYDITDVAGRLTFAAGETVKVVRVHITDDFDSETSENFLFQLSGVSSNATIARAVATGTIIDDDTVPPVTTTDIVGSSQAQLLLGTSLNDRIKAGAGDDVVYGWNGNDAISGEDGNDILEGGAGHDVLNGGNGTDTASYVTAGRSVTVNLGLTTAQNTVGAGSDKLISIENVTGSAFNDTLTGNSVANVLYGGTGNDKMTGNAGNDTYYVDSFKDVVIEAKNQGTDTVYSSVQFITGGQYIENVTLTGVLNSYAVGNALNNVLNGNSGKNNLTGGAGNDTLNGGKGADGMTGGIGNDIYYVDNLGDFIVEKADEGTDTVYSSVNFNIGGQYIEKLILTGTGNINGLGNAKVNTLTGNAGANMLDGRQGADTMSGGAGNDTYYVDNAGDKVIEANGKGADTVYSSVSFALGGQYIEKLILTGAGNINATGNSQANILIGNAGKNTLTGGIGHDTLTGGAGTDIFFFGAGSGKDTITDFSASQNDSLNLHAYNQATAVITQVGNDTVIDLGGGNIITLTGALKTDVTSHITW